MNIQKSTPGPNRVWSPRIEESPVGEPYFRSPTVDKSELEKLPVHFGNARDSFDGAFTYEAPVVERELASTVPNEHIPQAKRILCRSRCRNDFSEKTFENNF